MGQAPGPTKASMSAPNPAPTLPPFLERASSGTESLPPARRSPWKAIGAIVVVGIILVAIIFVAGVLPRSGPTSTTPTFSGAQQAANGAAGSYPGGSWSAIAAIALATNTPGVLTQSEIQLAFGASNCSVTWASSAPAVVIVPPTPLNATAGGAASWFFVYSSSAHALLVVVVTNGSAEPLFTATGGNCSLTAEAVTPLARTTVVDSNAAVAAANSKGGATFLADHPASNRTWAVVGQVLVYEPTWEVAYSDCPIPPPTNSTVNHTAFESTIDAQTGTAITGGSVNTTCSLAIPTSFHLPSAGALGDVSSPPQLGVARAGTRPAVAFPNPPP